LQSRLWAEGEENSKLNNVPPNHWALKNSRLATWRHFGTAYLDLPMQWISCDTGRTLPPTIAAEGYLFRSRNERGPSSSKVSPAVKKKITLVLFSARSRGNDPNEGSKNPVAKVSKDSPGAPKEKRKQRRLRGEKVGAH